MCGTTPNSSLTSPARGAGGYSNVSCNSGGRIAAKRARSAEHASTSAIIRIEPCDFGARNPGSVLEIEDPLTVGIGHTVCRLASARKVERRSLIASTSARHRRSSSTIRLISPHALAHAVHTLAGWPFDDEIAAKEPRSHALLFDWDVENY